MTDATLAKPPFRADHVGSFMRPAELLDARRQLNAGAITREQLRAVEDSCIREIVAMQEQVGIQSVTDGEFRRNSWRDNFFERTDGYSKDKVQSSFFFTEYDGRVHRGGSAPVAVDRLKRREPITADEFAALLPLVNHGIAKATIPSPTVNHFFTGDPGLAKGPYKGDRQAYFADMHTSRTSPTFTGKNSRICTPPAVVTSRWTKCRSRCSATPKTRRSYVSVVRIHRS
jgi:5-methyltetrahydropteroyltriglutamate--homocysteine methyltransferase